MTFTEEHEHLRTTLRRLLDEKAPSEAVRTAMDSAPGHDRALWHRMARELGLQGIALPEEHGGAGGGPVELGVVLEEFGRTLLPSPYFATAALAGQALTEAADTRWLPRIADGTLTATLALTDANGTTTATPDNGDSNGRRLTGTKMFVIDGHSADLLIVAAQDTTGPALFTVTGDAPGLTRTPLATLDPTRRQARLDLAAVPAVRLAADPRRVLDLVLVALAAEQVGGAQACLDMAVAYAKVRTQFGRPVGAFQAVKHKCADTLLKVEAARSAAQHALSVAAGAPDELPVAAALAAACCADAYTHAAKENIQIHGGTGYTWEHDAHLHLRRAKSSEHLFGGPAAHRGRLAELVGITATKG
ncbi:acyl-CoA dehydrogenase family protein [Streptomyces sp. NPDC004539]|uniref:acyl-CoA dehydrogenase family protein n=1 Tax=Streptomyces sp. NPDC004539 TaxID=3154280 RepID=UPI0033B21CA5